MSIDNKQVKADWHFGLISLFFIMLIGFVTAIVVGALAPEAWDAGLSFALGGAVLAGPLGVISGCRCLRTAKKYHGVYDVDLVVLGVLNIVSVFVMMFYAFLYIRMEFAWFLYCGLILIWLIYAMLKRQKILKNDTMRDGGTKNIQGVVRVASVIVAVVAVIIAMVVSILYGGYRWWKI